MVVVQGLFGSMSMASWVTKARQLVAHRGNSWDHPENSRASILSAIKMGADVIEFDISLTLDGFAIVLHGPTLQKTTTGRGKAGALQWTEVREMVLVDSEGRETQETVPSVEGILREFGSDSFWNLDIKDAGSLPDLVPLIDELELSNRIVLSGLNLKEVRGFLRLHENINMLVNLSRLDKVILIFGFFVEQWFIYRYREVAADPSVIAINVNHRYVSNTLVKAIHSLGIEVWAFTVDDLQVVNELFEMGVNSVTTNRPEIRNL